MQLPLSIFDMQTRPSTCSAKCWGHKAVHAGGQQDAMLLRCAGVPHLIHAVEAAMRDKCGHACVAQQVLLRRPIHYLPPK